MMSVLRTVSGLVSLAAALGAIVLWLSGGITTRIGGVSVSATDPARPLLVFVAATLVFAWLSGVSRLRRDVGRLSQRLTPARLTLMLALAVTGMSIAWNAWAVGGADDYSYVQQADSWLHGSLIIRAPIAAEAPWPDALRTFTPYGYGPAPGANALVPTTGPGLPLIMAAMKLVAGHAAMFLVAPLAGGLLVWATFLLARRATSSDWPGLGAAWIVATSPTVLLMSHSVMSDVPVTACWAFATACLLATGVPSSIAAGAWAAVAIMIRPNLVPLAAVLGAWSLWRDVASRDWRLRRTLVYAAAAVPGVLVVAAFNHHLYGNALRSGYGDLAVLFSWNHVWPNFQNYARGITSTQTPFFALGLVGLALPLTRLWTGRTERAAAILLLAIVVSATAIYAGYQPFDAWWYLRFLLPAWPAMATGVAALALQAAARTGPRVRRVAAASVCVVGIATAITAGRLGVYPPGEGQRRYATVAALVAQATEPSAVVITGQHVGALRYYGGRLTLRYDALDPAWLGRAIDWFRSHDRRVYILLEDWERGAFTARFGNNDALARLDAPPALAYEAPRIPGHVFLYDTQRDDRQTYRPLPARDPGTLCPLPAPPVALAAWPRQR